LPQILPPTTSQRLEEGEKNGAAPSLWQRQTRSTKGESDGLSSSKIIISHPTFVDAQRLGKHASYVVFAASPASYDSTHSDFQA
jgi:hypothetical protein